MIWIQKHTGKLILFLILVLFLVLILTIIRSSTILENLALKVGSMEIPVYFPQADPHLSDLEGLDITIPKQSDWVDYGTIITSGYPGEWDLFLFGGLVHSVIKKDGVYYLYYQGSGGYDPEGDTVTGRAVGVATSTDGINFTKYENNPILSWSPHDNGEEGVFSIGTTSVDGEIIMYYGALTEQNSSKVNSDIRLAISSDGLNFEDKGVVLSFQDRNVWGSGDELSPIIAIEEAGEWFLYYIPNGVPQRHQLGVAFGDDPETYAKTSGVQSGWQGINTWSSGSSASVSPGKYALFVKNPDKNQIDVRLVSLEKPTILGEPVESYFFDYFANATVLLDEETNTWFMYYLDADKTLNVDQARYGVKIAPAGSPDNSPPTAPKNVRMIGYTDRVKLTWDPALDEDTGIVQYKIYRNGSLWSIVKGQVFETSDTIEPSDRISVTAVNYHGTEGPPSAPVTLGQKSLQHSRIAEKECKEKNHQ